MSNENFLNYVGSSTTNIDFTIEGLTNRFKANIDKSSFTIEPSKDKTSLHFIFSEK